MKYTFSDSDVNVFKSCLPLGIKSILQFNPNNSLCSTYNGGANHQLSSTTICLITTFQTNLPEIDFDMTKIFYNLCEMDFAKQIVCVFSVALVSLSDQIFSHFFSTFKKEEEYLLVFIWKSLFILSSSGLGRGGLPGLMWANEWGEVESESFLAPTPPSTDQPRIFHYLQSYFGLVLLHALVLTSVVIKAGVCWCCYMARCPSDRLSQDIAKPGLL